MSAHGPDPELVIVPMTVEDLDAVMAIEQSSFRNPSSEQALVDELSRPWACIDLLRQGTGSGGPVLAYANYWLVADELHLLNIATAPEARRRGYGGRLMAHLLERARRERCRCVTLEVRRSNETAQRLYRRYGFTSIGVRPSYYADNQEDAIVMLLQPV